MQSGRTSRGRIASGPGAREASCLASQRKFAPLRAHYTQRKALRRAQRTNQSARAQRPLTEFKAPTFIWPPHLSTKSGETERINSNKSADVDAQSKDAVSQVASGVVPYQARQNQGNEISDSAPMTFTARASLINLQTSNSQDSASLSPASLVNLPMASRRQSSTTSVVTKQSQRGSPNSLKFERPVDPSLESLTQFMNASLIQQKRLKANNSQITMAAKEFTKLKIQHEPSFARPPTTTSAIRAEKYADLHKLCSRYDKPHRTPTPDLGETTSRGLKQR